MMNIRIPILNFLILLSAFSSFGQKKIIFDTDFGGDADDLMSLVMLNRLSSAGECEILAVMSWSVEEDAIASIDAVNSFYGHPGIPLAVRSYDSFTDSANYGKAIARKFPSALNNASVPLSVDLYRQILSAQDDHSVSIVTVGPLKNILDLVRSGPDQYSWMNGNELVSMKVNEFIVMGGGFPEYKNEWNFNGNMPGVTRAVFDSLKVPVTFLGYETGVQIKTGEVLNDLNTQDPLSIGFMHFSRNASWMKDNFKGKILDNSSYDQTAVLYAVRNGLGEYWNRVEGGKLEILENGDCKWIAGKNSSQSYLVLITEPEEMAEIIESIALGIFK